MACESFVARMFPRTWPDKPSRSSRNAWPPTERGSAFLRWGNLSVEDGALKSEFGFVEPPPRGRAFKRELEGELDRMRAFLSLKS